MILVDEIFLANGRSLLAGVVRELLPRLATNSISRTVRDSLQRSRAHDIERLKTGPSESPTP